MSASVAAAVGQILLGVLGPVETEMAFGLLFTGLQSHRSYPVSVCGPLPLKMPVRITLYTASSLWLLIQ